MKPFHVRALFLGLATSVVAGPGLALIDPAQVAMPTDRMETGGVPHSPTQPGLSAITNRTGPTG